MERERRRAESSLLTPSFAPAKGDFMSKRFITLLMIVAAPLLAQQPPQNPQPFGEKVDVNLVQLDAIVTDSRGNQMLGLGKDDFVVRENGQPLAVDSVDYFTNRRLINAPESAAAFKVERVHDERYLIFFFDKVTSDFSSQAEMIRARNDAFHFLDDRLRPEDRVAIVGHDVRLKVYTDFTSDKAKIRRALNDATAYGLGIRTKSGSPASSLLANMDIDRMINKTGSVYEALDLLGDALRPIHARKDIVIFSNGILGPDEDVRGGMVTNRSRYYDPMIQSLNSADVTLYPISLQNGINVPEFVHQNLTSMASDTNGQYYRFHTSYVTPLQQIEKQTAGYYLLSYYTKKRPGEHGFQKVSVTLHNPEFKVSARSGYSYGD
jgi:VWFA-related protein